MLELNRAHRERNHDNKKFAVKDHLNYNNFLREWYDISVFRCEFNKLIRGS